MKVGPEHWTVEHWMLMGADVADAVLKMARDVRAGTAQHGPSELYRASGGGDLYRHAMIEAGYVVPRSGNQNVGRDPAYDTCPTCGTPAEVVTGNEGTSHYVPVDGGLLARWAVVEEAEARVAELESEVSLYRSALEAIAENYAMADNVERIARDALKGKRHD